MRTLDSPEAVPASRVYVLPVGVQESVTNVPLTVAVRVGDAGSTGTLVPLCVTVTVALPNVTVPTRCGPGFAWIVRVNTGRIWYIGGAVTEVGDTVIHAGAVVDMVQEGGYPLERTVLTVCVDDSLPTLSVFVVMKFVALVAEKNVKHGGGAWAAATREKTISKRSTSAKFGLLFMSSRRFSWLVR